MAKVLVVDDDSGIREVVAFSLRREGHDVVEARDGAEGLRLFETSSPDLVLLDIMMPEMDGRECCRRIRQQSEVPIIFLTAMDDEVDMIIGLEIGGDDYVAKPFSTRYLVARVRAMLRRAATALQPTETVVTTHGKLILDPATFAVTWDGVPVTLTVTEFSLLQALIRHPGHVLSRSQLMDAAYDGVVVSDRTIDSHVRRLRNKFARVGGEPVQTVHGAGYRLGACD